RRVLGRRRGRGTARVRHEPAVRAVPEVGRRGSRRKRPRARALHRAVDRRAAWGARRALPDARSADAGPGRVAARGGHGCASGGRRGATCRAGKRRRHRREALGMKVLLADDDPDLLSVTGFALQQAGFLVVTATDGQRALEAFEREQPDLAVLDINMPKVNGFDVARKLREKSSVPVLMLTVRSEEDDVVRALSLGADDYLTKPFSPKILI